jgi:hypothetical protein
MPSRTPARQPQWKFIVGSTQPPLHYLCVMHQPAGATGCQVPVECRNYTCSVKWNFRLPKRKSLSAPVFRRPAGGQAGSQSSSADLAILVLCGQTTGGGPYALDIGTLGCTIQKTRIKAIIGVP